MLIWLHDEALRADHPVFAAAPDAPDTRCVFIWDDALFQEMHYGLKKLIFIYEALMTLPVDIIAGDTETVLRDLADGGPVFTAETSNPRYAAVMERLARDCECRRIPDEPFVQLSSTPDLKRFFRYWNKARKSAMQPHGGMADLFGGGR